MRTRTTMHRSFFSSRLIALLLVGMLGFSGISAQAAVPLDRILVIVNDEVITEHDLQQKLKSLKTQLAGKDEKVLAAARKQLLDQLILEKIQLQYAKRIGIDVDDEMVDKAVKRIADQNKFSVRQLRQALERDGLGYKDFRESIRNEIIIKRLLDQEINNSITVSESEVDNFIAQRRGAGNEDVEFNVDHILLPFGPLTPEQAKQQAQAALKRIQAGENFTEVARQMSRGPNAKDGGKLGWRKTSQLPAVFVSTLSGLQPGQTAVVESPNGYHVLKLNEKRGGSQLAVSQYHVRHILLRPNELMSLEDAKNKLLQLRERINNGEDFAELARAHSADKGSASKGGDLGWIGPGVTVKPFEEAVRNLQVGDISEPVRTAFGVHLIQVLGVRQKDVSQERDRGLARQKIMQMKSEERYEQWLRQLKDEAYVEYKPGS
ncbi:MAG: molecular chaperone SurA [Gammaproteobacteria bacterium]|nr:MAG: molecular chaperone SurA [Gammaproteobacteria bacterium]